MQHESLVLHPLCGTLRGQVVKDANLKYSKLLDHLTTVGLSLARATCETSQVLLVGGQMVFLGDLPFFASPSD